MNISNATAAGPSYGLLDVIFGTKPKEEPPTDGQEFSPLMNLIKALNNQKSQDDASRGRTEQETATGRGTADSRVVGIPGWQPHQAAAEPVASRSEEGLPEQTIPRRAGISLAQPEYGPVPKTVPEEVHRMLRERSLAPLTAEEGRLLEAMSARAAEARPETAMPAKAPNPDPVGAHVAALAGRVGVTEAPTVRAEESQQMHRAGIPEMPEKFLSTEAYLQMHDRFVKGQPKTLPDEEGAAQRWSRSGSSDAPVRSADEEVRFRVPETAGKDNDLFGRAGRDPASPHRVDGAERGAAEPGPLLPVPLAISGGDTISRDIMLGGFKPEQVRETLVGEVKQSVNFQALKGGGEMKLVIHPEEMGEVHLKVGTKNGSVEVRVVAENEEVARLIRSGSKELESSLREQSLALAKFEVKVADGPVTQSESKGSLADQFLQQQNHGFSQDGSGDDRGFGRWDNDSRQGPGFGVMAEQNGKAAAAGDGPSGRNNQARDSSRRLDVVA
jgi:hypothetical protein